MLPWSRAGGRGRPHRGPTILITLTLLAGVVGVPPAAARTPIEPAALPTGSEALVGTMGFRSPATAFLGQYVTTNIAVDTTGKITGRDVRMKARSTANPLLFELGLFRDLNGRFRLLAENGRWLALKASTSTTSPGGIMTAAATKWADAWAFRAIRPAPTAISMAVGTELDTNGVDRALPVCFQAYQNGVSKGLLGLDGTGWLVVVAGASCGKSTLTMFMTDDLPTDAAVSTLLAAPKTPIDEITRVRFVPPDRPALTLTATERRMVIAEINLYFNSLRDMNSRIFLAAKDDVQLIQTYLSVTTELIPGDEEEETDWWSFAEGILTTAASFIPEYGEAISTAITIVSQVAQIGVSMVENANLEGPRVVPGVTNAQISTMASLVKKLDTENTRTGRNIETLRVMLKEGCATPWTAGTCVNDRRLAQWMAKPAVFPEYTQNYEDHQVFAHRGEFYQRLLPIRGVLYNKWTNVPSECFDRAFSREESLGDTGQAGFGSGDWQGATDKVPVVMFSSVRLPWHNVKWCYSGAKWSERPIATAWAFGLTHPTGPITPLPVDTAFEALFEPYDAKSPLDGGLGLSYKTVACEWLTNAPSNYWADGKRYDPCHFSFYDPGATTATLVNNTARWVRSDGNTAATYNAAATAIAWFVPDRHEVVDKRQADDPDIFSWQIPRPEYASCADTPRLRSTATGVGTKVYFANLTDVAIRIRRVNPDGTYTTVADIPKWVELDHPIAGYGAIDYKAGSTGMVAVSSWVGARYVAQALSGGKCIGVYSVEEPPPGSVLYQVAEVHSHADLLGGILDH